MCLQEINQRSRKPIELHMQNEKCKSPKGRAQIDSLRPKKVPYSLCRDVMARACTESNQRSKSKLEAQFPFKIPPILHTYTCQSAICDWFTLLLSRLYFNHFWSKQEKLDLRLNLKWIFVKTHKKQNFVWKLNYFSHGLRTPNEGINQRHLKIWADVADKICCRHT